MNRVALSAEDVPLPEWSKTLKSYTGKVLAELGKDKWDLSILLCGDKTITKLNRQYRGKDESTDILSFALDEGLLFPAAGKGNSCRRLPGDIVISLDTLRENARRFKISEDEELRRLLIHGILHLDGMDHVSNKKTEPMLSLQEEILAKLSGESIINTIHKRGYA
ncbi:MAG: rRNA maturation RNase YbeY [Treponema sp.]|nr:rRNA maturation RNase YbeY [Treponema sp.]